MKEKKEVQISENVSSGAEKVERVEKTVKTKADAGKTTAKTTAKTDVKKVNAESTNGKAEKESAAAKARVEAALKKKEEKARRAEEKAKMKAKKAEERAKKAQARAAEREKRLKKAEEERKARAEKRKEKREALRRERAHEKANRSQARSKAKNNRKEKRQRNEKGYGGWLAAVVSLGAITLALTTAVTIGAIDMKRTNDTMMMGHRSTAYELIGIMEHVDEDLDRARVSASIPQQERILTDLLVQARLAELDLEKMPIDIEKNRNLTKFINHVAKESERMLAVLRNGGKLSKEDQAVLQRLYETAHTAREKLDEFAANMTDKDLMQYMKKGEGAFKSMLDGLEELTLAENRADLEGKMPKMKGAGMERKAIEPSEEAGSPKIDPAKAEEMCKTYFSEYKIDEFQCIGETVARGYTAYNVQGFDDKGTMLFAELDYRNGELIRFDYFEPCENMTLDTDNAKAVAEKFLQKLGYDDMSVVRVRENGTDVDFTYVFTLDGVAYYPDTVRVKVCRERGVVTGMDAAKYLKNHTTRQEPNVSLTLETAKNNLHEGVEVESAKLAVVETLRGERAAYEFLCSYMGERYFIYTDANNGEEISIVNLKNIG